MRIRAVVASIAAVLSMPVVADADWSLTTANVNLRSGAGVDHARITTLPRGTEVAIDHCLQGWCLVETLGVSGWVSARYLAQTRVGTGIVQPYDPTIVRAPPVATFDFVVPRDVHDLGYSRLHKPNRDFHGAGR